MEEIVTTEIDLLKVEVCDPFPVQTGSNSYTMEDLEQSSLEEKVDLGNLVLFPPDSYVNEEIEEVNFTIEDEPLENKIDCDISDKTDVKKEVIEPPVHEYETTQIEFSTNSNVNCQTCGLEFGNKVVLKIHNSMVHPEGKKIDQNKIRMENIENSIPKDRDLSTPITSSFHEGIKNNAVQKQTKKTSFNQKYKSKTYIETVHEKNKPSRRDISYSKSALKSILIPRTENDQTKPYKCIECEHRTANKTALSRHINRVHDNSKSFKCRACDFETANQFHLKNHTQSVHKGSKPLKCKLCNFETAQKSGLKFHIESVHEGIKPFNCCICNYKSAKKYDLKKHIETVHEGIKPFKCNICDYKASAKWTLRVWIISAVETG